MTCAHFDVAFFKRECALSSCFFPVSCRHRILRPRSPASRSPRCHPTHGRHAPPGPLMAIAHSIFMFLILHLNICRFFSNEKSAPERTILLNFHCFDCAPFSGVIFLGHQMEPFSPSVISRCFTLPFRQFFPPTVFASLCLMKRTTLQGKSEICG